MKRETRLLLNRATQSLVLAVEHFNRPSDISRHEAVLVFLDHAFEMVLKAAIIHQGGRIREKRAQETIGFEQCVRKCLSDAQVKCLTDDQAATIRTINGLRDAAMHHILELSEQQLYLHTQSGVTLFDDFLRAVFAKTLADILPERVLPVSTRPPTDILIMVDERVTQIRGLLKAGTRRALEARAGVRALAIMERALDGQSGQPREGDLQRFTRRLKEGEAWTSLFPGVAGLRIDVEGGGPVVSLRISKTEGFPTKLVKEGEEPAAVIAVRRVEELGYYSLGATEVAKHVGLTVPKAGAVIRHLRLQEDPEYFKEIWIGKSRHKRYSQKAIQRIEEVLPTLDMDSVWQDNRPRPRPQAAT